MGSKTIAARRIALEALDAQGNGLCVEFLTLADRYGHQVRSVVDGRPSALLLRSQEGPQDVPLQCVPALQGLNIENLSQGDAAALIGMSGSNHWSLTIEPRLVEGQPQLFFDAACRIKAAPPSLVSCYEVVERSGFEIATATPDGEAPCAVTNRPGEIRIVRKAAAKPPATLRWQYLIYSA